jgi:rod shape-determining protein MreC
LIQHGPGGGSQLVFGRVSKDKVVKLGDFVVTAGTQLTTLPDIYPRGILIGKVTSVYQNNVDEFKHVQVDPFADFSSLDSVAILVPQNRR